MKSELSSISRTGVWSAARANQLNQIVEAASIRPVDCRTVKNDFVFWYIKILRNQYLLSETDNFWTWRLSVEENYRFLRVKYIAFQHFFPFVLIFTDSEK